MSLLNKKDLSSLYNYDVEDMPNILDIRSEIVEPLSSSSKKYVFRLEPTGYLDSNSLLMFKIRALANSGELRVNSLNGALGAIKRVQFSVGDFVLNDVDACAKWATLNGMMTKDRATQNRVDSHYLGNQFYSKVATTRVANGNEVGEVVIDNVKSGLSYGGYDNASTAGNAVDGIATRINSLPLTDVAGNNGYFAVPLGYIIPALNGRRIPLFLFDEYRIYITIEFADADEFVNNITKTDYAGGETLGAEAGQIEYTNVKLHIDYLLYPAEVMEQEKAQVNKEGGYQMVFYDVVRVMKSLPAQAQSNQTQKVEFRIGQNNRELHKIFMTKEKTALAGRRDAFALGQAIDGINSEAVNWNINGEDEFPLTLDNPSFQYNQTAYALNGDLDVERPLFFCDNNSQWACIAGATNGLNGKYKPLAHDLNGQPGIIGAGRFIGKYPIICKYERCGYDGTGANDASAVDFAVAHNVDFYCMASRTAVISSGVKGNNVVVSY